MLFKLRFILPLVFNFINVYGFWKCFSMITDNFLPKLCCFFSSFREIEELPLRIEGDFNYDRFLELNKVLKNLPLDVNGIISNYEYIDPVVIIQDHIMTSLSVPQEERDKLNFYSNDFPIQLEQMLELKKEKISVLDPFLYDLSTLLFKWIIHIRENYFDDESNFNRLLNFTISMSSMIHSKGHSDFPMNLNTYSMESKSVSRFLSMMNCELAENPRNSFLTFGSIIEEFYVNGNSDCDKLIDKYFNGHINKNILLKYMIYFHDPHGFLRQECFPENEYSKFPISDPSVSINSKYIMNLKAKGPKAIRSSCIGRMTNSAIEYLLGRKSF